MKMIRLVVITTIVAIQEQMRVDAHYIIMEMLEVETIVIVGVALWEIATLIRPLAKLVLVKDNLEIA